MPKDQKKLSVEIPGNIIIELEGYEPLFDIIYSYSSDEIAKMLNSITQKYKTNKGRKVSLIEIEELNFLSNLSKAFAKMKKTPIVVLIKE